MPLGPARDRDAAAAVAPENLQDLLRLRPAQQLLKPRDVFETQFQGLRELVDVAWDRLVLHPIALLLKIQESAQTGGAWAASRAHVRYHGEIPRSASEWLLGLVAAKVSTAAGARIISATQLEWAFALHAHAVKALLVNGAHSLDASIL